jgi:hypothetical protein
MKLTTMVGLGCLALVITSVSPASAQTWVENSYVQSSCLIHLYNEEFGKPATELYELAKPRVLGVDAPGARSRQASNPPGGAGKALPRARGRPSSQVNGYCGSTVHFAPASAHRTSNAPA